MPGPDDDRFTVWRRRFVAIRLGLGLVILLALLSLIAAARTAAPLDIVPWIAAWFVGQVLALAGLVLGLRALRRRRFGSPASARFTGADDVLLHLGCGVGGVFALLLFIPEIAGGEADVFGCLIAGLGAVLLVVAVRGGLLYALRP